MSQHVLNWPDDLADAIRISPAEIPFRIGLMAAIKMFELGELSSCKAAELAKLTRGEFLEACARYHVSAFNYRDDEVEAELDADLKTLRAASP